MLVTPALHFDLDKKEIDELNYAIQTLRKYEKIFIDTDYETARNLFHETRCRLIMIRDDTRIGNADKMIER